MNAAPAVRALLFGPRAEPRRGDALTTTQIAWLGALLAATQLPQAVHLPRGIALLGIALTGLRLLLLRFRRASALRPPSWALALFAAVVAYAIYRMYGYFLGREPSVAFLYVLAGIKFLEARARRDGTLIVCLASFLLITPFLVDQSMAAAAAALPALLVLGGALDTLQRRTQVAGPGQWRVLLWRAATLFVQGLPIAALLFILFPRLAGPLWGLPTDHRARSGLSDRMTPGMFSELILSDEVAFRVDFDGPLPLPPQRYWRGPVLSRFDGRTWSVGSLQAGAAPAQAGGRSVAYTVTLEPSDQPRLFALDLPTSLPRAGFDDDGNAVAPRQFLGLTRDLQLLLRAPATQTMQYAITSSLHDAYPATSARETAANMQLPPGNPRAVAFARELRGRVPDAGGYVAAVLGRFRDEPFVYTLAAPLYEREPVDEFLFEKRRGFCEHYASAFVVLMRAAGLPARVVTGYQGGEMNPNGGYLIVRQSDAHAWAEVQLGGLWRRFDPTAAVAPSRIERGLGSALPAGEIAPLFAGLGGGWRKDLALAFDALNHVWRGHVVNFNYQRQRALWRDFHLGGASPWQIVGVLSIAAALWAGAMLLWLALRRRRRERTLALWEELCRRLARAGLPRAQHEGPLAFAQRAAARWPQFGIAFAAIGEAYATLRYGDLPQQSRAALVRTLAHAIGALPSARALRRAAPAG
jgi:transglutaminase-like putative cysteine protease